MHLYCFSCIEKKGFQSSTVQNVPVTAFDALLSTHLPQNKVLRSAWYSVGGSVSTGASWEVLSLPPAA